MADETRKNGLTPEDQEQGTETRESTVQDSGVQDSGVQDSGGQASGDLDSSVEPVDSSVPGSGVSDSGGPKTGPTVTGTPATSAPQADPTEVAPPEAVPPETDPTETSPTVTGTPETSATETGAPPISLPKPGEDAPQPAPEEADNGQGKVQAAQQCVLGLWAWLRSAWTEGRDQTEEISRTTHLFFLLCAGVVVFFFIWAALFRLDIVSVAGGEVVPRSKVKRVQHLEGGIVREILVREGDAVIEGQPLVILEEVLTESSVEELKVRVDALRTEVARLEAEDQGLEAPVFPLDLLERSPDLVDQALNLFETRQNRLDNELQSQVESIHQREQDIIEIEARLKSLNANLPLVRKQVAKGQELYKDRLIKEDELIARQKEMNNTISAIAENEAALQRAHSMLTSANATLENIQNSFMEEVRTELRGARQELSEVEQRLIKFTDIEQRTVIRSPVDGVINSLYVMGEGEVIKPGITIMDIVPAGDKLVIEAKLPIKDIGYVQVGQKAMIKLPSADARRFGSLEGVVAHISPDALALPTGETYYLVRIETEKDYFERGNDRYRLFPGMKVLAAIHTGQRTVLQYLAYPYFDALAEGLQER